MSETIYIRATGECFALYSWRYKFNIIHHYSTSVAEYTLNFILEKQTNKKIKTDAALEDFSFHDWKVSCNFRSSFISCIHLKYTVSFFLWKNHRSVSVHAALSHLVSPWNSAAIILLIMKHLFCTCLIYLIIVLWAMKSDRLDQRSLLHLAFSPSSTFIKHLRKMTLAAMCLLSNTMHCANNYYGLVSSQIQCALTWLTAAH